MTISRQLSKLTGKLALLLIVASLHSCGSHAPRQFAGTITDGTMNTVTVRALADGKTITFSTMDADKTAAEGMLVGAPVLVDYEGGLQKSPVATKVVTDVTYTRAIGSWTIPDPIAPKARMGVKIMIEGKAASINMASLTYTSWALQGEANKIVLHGQSLGNRQTIDVTDRASIWKKDGRMFLSIEGTDIVYEKARN